MSPKALWASPGIPLGSSSVIEQSMEPFTPPTTTLSTIAIFRAIIDYDVVDVVANSVSDDTSA